MWLLLACRCGDAPERAPGHYMGAILARDAVIRADLDALHAAARELEDPGMKDTAVEDLHGALGMAVAAEDLEEGGWAVAGIVEACGDCHAGKVGPVSATAGPHGHDRLWADLVSGREIDASGFKEVAPTEATALALASTQAERASAYGDLLVRCSGCHPGG
ncbi:MAG TPA: hypothetical protein QGF58_23535 [Myxococcota bacterium]|nr:hypothetical protein [Myxococcota bacterium]